MGQQRSQQADRARRSRQRARADQINSLAAQSGLSSDELLKGLSQYLPDVINHLTPMEGCRTSTNCQAGFDLRYRGAVCAAVYCHWDIRRGP